MTNTKAYALAAIVLASRVLNDARIVPTMIDVDMICEARLSANKGDYTKAYNFASLALAPYIYSADHSKIVDEHRAGIFEVHAEECRAA